MCTSLWFTATLLFFDLVLTVLLFCRAAAASEQYRFDIAPNLMFALVVPETFPSASRLCAARPILGPLGGHRQARRTERDPRLYDGYRDLCG